MAELAGAFGEAVYLAAIRDGEALLRDMVDCRKAITTTSFVGGSIPLPGAASGTPKSGTLPGVIIDAGGMNPEITTVSALFHGSGGQAEGALVVLAPSYRISLERIHTEIAPALDAAARRFSRRLGCPADNRATAYPSRASGCMPHHPNLVGISTGSYRQNGIHCHQ